jgi:CBS domain-containing protein
VRGTFRRFPVLDGGRLVGVISRHDVLRAIELW